MSKFYFYFIKTHSNREQNFLFGQAMGIKKIVFAEIDRENYQKGGTF